jgi:hypothetical protein
LHKDEEEGRKGGGKPVQEEEQGITIIAIGTKMKIMIMIRMKTTKTIILLTTIYAFQSVVLTS